MQVDHCLKNLCGCIDVLIGEWLQVKCTLKHAAKTRSLSLLSHLFTLALAFKNVSADVNLLVSHGSMSGLHDMNGIEFFSHPTK